MEACQVLSTEPGICSFPGNEQLLLLLLLLSGSLLFVIHLLVLTSQRQGGLDPCREALDGRSGLSKCPLAGFSKDRPGICFGASEGSSLHRKA